MFSKKLDLLMLMTDTSNAQLATVLHIDPSYISRLRNGKRALPKNPDFLPELIEYFGKRLWLSAQWDLLKEPFKGALPEDKERVNQWLHNWLCYDGKEKSALEQFMETPEGTPLTPAQIPVRTQGPSSGLPQTFYIGIPGKRQAVMAFFQEVLNSPMQVELKLFSEEEMSWMVEDPAYLTQWQGTLMEILKKGHRICIIHNVSRPLDELMESVIQWLPVYTTGAIRSYYLTRKRDGIFQRTIFLAPGIAGISSHAVQMQSKDMLNVFTTHRPALDALEQEFNNTLKLCRPLLKVTTEDLENAFLNNFKRIMSGRNGVFYKSCYPAPYTLPDALAVKLDRSGQRELPVVGGKMRDYFIATLRDHVVHDILLEPTVLLKKLKELEGKKETAPSTQLCRIAYTQEDLLAHYREILELLYKYENYYVSFLDHINHEATIFLGLHGEVMVERRTPPAALMTFSEKNMYSAFLYQLKESCSLNPKTTREVAIGKLEALFR